MAMYNKIASTYKIYFVSLNGVHHQIYEAQYFACKYIAPEKSTKKEIILKMQAVGKKWPTKTLEYFTFSFIY